MHTIEPIDFVLRIGFRVDQLTVVMLAAVTFVGMLALANGFRTAMVVCAVLFAVGGYPSIAALVAHFGGEAAAPPP